MTKTKHTQGKWEAKRQDVYCNGTRIAIAEQAIGLRLSVNQDESEANARLIAAAPKMLEALKKVLNPDMSKKSRNIFIESIIKEVE